MEEDEEYVGPASEVMEELYKITESGNFNHDRIPGLCERALALDANCFPAHVYLGYYEIDRKNRDKMFDHFLKALDMSDHPYNTFTWDMVVMALDDGLKDYERLVTYLHRFFEKEPKLFVARYLARTLGGKLKRGQEAVAVLNEYLLRHPDDKKALKIRKKAEKGKWLWI